MEKKVRIKQVRSRIGRPKDQKATLDALGLKKMNQVKEVSLSPQMAGMINKVKHLLQIEEI
jgi:large subunit ribosomal protein L30